MSWPQILSEDLFRRLINAKDYYIEDRVCVVGIIGKGKIGHRSKAYYTNAMIEKNVFKADFISDTRDDITDESQCVIEMFHDVEQRIIYLHLVSVFDTGRLVHLAENIIQSLSASENHKTWRSHEHKHARALLFIFSVCHLAVVVHPTQTFDVSYVKLFRTLAVARHRMLSSVTQLLSGIDDIPDIWRQTGRPCIPRILCSFQQNPGALNEIEPVENRDSYANRARGRTQTSSPLEKTQRALGEQIYSIMKKARLLGSLSSSSLFTVSTGHEFVHIQPNTSVCDPVNILLNTLAKNSINTNWALSSTLLKGRCPKVKNLLASINEPHLNSCSETKVQDGVLFKDFLREHIDHLMTGEGRDGLAEGRRGTHVEVPTCRLWSKVCLVLFEFFIGSKGDTHSQIHSLSDQLDLDTKFSEGRCRKVMPLATSAYRENLPSHYTQSVHVAQLSKALSVFAMHARGPSFDYFAEKLKDQCNEIWLNGRQLCEERSLTGRQCVYAYHRVPDPGDLPEETDKSSSISLTACKPHSSRITSICACNCGRTEIQRDDPFSIRAANYDFYKSLEEKCCGSLTYVSLPTHPSAITDKLATSPTNKELRSLTETLGALTLGTNSGEQETASNPAPVPNKTTSVIHLRDGKEIISGNRNSFGSNVVFSYQSAADNASHDDKSMTSSMLGNSSAGGLSCGQDQVSHDGRMSPSARQYDTDVQPKRKYLESMLTLNTPPGLLPRFPSWSLCRLGNSSLYQPSKGLDQPGFFPGSNFLLAWDIPVLDESHSGMSSYFDGQVKHPGSKSTSSEAWPTLSEVPSAVASSTLPLFAALSYAHQQFAEYVTISPPIVAPNVVKPAQSGGRGQRRNTRETITAATLRVWVGDEYECPRGHRFICSGPDKMVKSNSSGQVKETAHKLITSHMPLYFPCPCRSNKPFMAQLTRVFVVTPDSPFLIKLNPCVQPAAPPCPVFYPGVKSGITLPPASMCVLRFPYVYVGELGPILPPSDAQPLLNCRVLKGMFSVMQHKNEEIKEERPPTKP